MKTMQVMSAILKLQYGHHTGSEKNVKLDFHIPHILTNPKMYSLPNLPKL